MKQRAAVILSGRVKGWQYCLNDFEKALQLYDFDVYCSLNCSEQDSDYLEFSKYSKVKKIQAIPSDSLIDYSLYNITADHPRAKVISMFLHNKLAFNLIEDKTYDVYIKARNDIHSSDLKGINITRYYIDEFTKEELNKLWIPHCHRYGTYKFTMNDQFALGNYEVMQKYFALYDHLTEFVEDYGDLTPETILAAYIDKNNIEFDKFEFAYFLSARRHNDSENEVAMWSFLSNMLSGSIDPSDLNKLFPQDNK